jgi:sortase A
MKFRAFSLFLIIQITVIAISAQTPEIGYQGSLKNTLRRSSAGAAQRRERRARRCAVRTRIAADRNVGAAPAQARRPRATRNGFSAAPPAPAFLEESVMRRPWNGALPITVTLPLGLEHRPRARRRRWRRVGIGALIALGVALLAAGVWLPAKAELAQHLLNRAWARTVEGDAAAKPWPWADTRPIARLSLPNSDEPLTVLAGASGRNLAFAPALMDGSAAPGANGVSVIAGHRDTHFRPLASLAIGDELTLERPDGSFLRYEVAALDVVDSRRAQLRLDADESVVVLVTCWPFDAVDVGGDWRYVVTARMTF